MVQKYTFQICQMLAIAAALAAALCCLPVAAQNTQANEILILNDKPVTFSEFLKTYPDNDARAKALSPLPRETKRAFRDWEMAQLNKRSAEKDAEMARLTKKSALQDIAMNLYKEIGVVFTEIHKEQGSSGKATPEQLARNKKRAAIIFAALANPALANSDIGGNWDPEIRSAMELVAKSLQTGETLNPTVKILIKSVADAYK